jgi:hypothetical protein
MQWSRGIGALLVLALVGCSQPAPIINVQPPQVNVPAPIVNVPAPSVPTSPTYSLNILSGNQQVGASGMAFPAPLVVQAVDAKGQGVPDLSLNVSTDSRLCSFPTELPLTNAEGKLSLVLTAGAATDVVCQTMFTLNGLSASSRSSVSFSSYIRSAQRNLIVSPTVSLPSAIVTIEDATQSRFAFSDFSNWPLLPPSHVFAAYAFRFGPRAEIECVRYLGNFPENVNPVGILTVSLSMGTLPSSPTGCGSVGPGPVNNTGSAAALFINAVAVVLQSTLFPPTSTPDIVRAAFLIGTGTAPSAGGSTRMDLTLRAFGPQSLIRFEVAPYSPQGRLTLESPYLAYNAYNSGFSATFSNFPRNPPGFRYAVYRVNADERRFRIARFAVDGSEEPIKISYRLPQPSNATPPGQALDQKSEFRRVFVTLEPVSVDDQQFPTSFPGSILLMDTENAGAWTMRVR